MSSIPEQKAQLRHRQLAKRASLSQVEWESKSRKIHQHFFENERLNTYDSMHCYLSMNNRFEVNTYPLVEFFLHSGKQVAVPITNFSTGSLTHSFLHSLDELKINEWGVAEPLHIDEVPSDFTGLIVVPLLAADLQGNRLGYGKGFYDRFLAKTSALKMGLLFDAFIVDHIPVEEHDQKLDGIITEKGVRYLQP